MSKKIKLTETQINSIVNRVINEYGKKGRWKPEWYEEDQMLAMYNSFYGIQELGLSKEEAANNIIGSSLASFNQQSSNFDFLDGRGGLDRESYKQEAVYKKYKNVPKQEFKRICLNIIQKRIENPDPAAVRYKLGQEIGNKKDEIQREREKGLKDKGVNPDRATLIGSRVKNFQDEDVPENEPEDITEKERIRDFIKSISERMRSINSKSELNKLADDLDFVIEYIDSTLTDVSTENVVSEIVRVYRIIT